MFIFGMFPFSLFSTYIYFISDNYTKRDDLIVKINAEQLQKEIADFPVIFTVIDENGNKIEKQILVKIREFMGPILNVVDVIHLDVGEDVDLLEFVSASDPYDEKVNERILIDFGDFNINEAGQYTVIYKCFNTSGIYTEKEVKVIVGDAGNKEAHSFEENVDFIGIVITISIIVITISGALIFYFARRSFKRKRNTTRV